MKPGVAAASSPRRLPIRSARAAQSALPLAAAEPLPVDEPAIDEPAIEEPVVVALAEPAAGWSSVFFFLQPPPSATAATKIHVVRIFGPSRTTRPLSRGCRGETRPRLVQNAV